MDGKPTKEVLVELYINQRISPEAIGAMFNRSGRSVRVWMTDYGIPRSGPGHLRKGVSATWNVGIQRTAETLQKMSNAQKGKIPHNFGQGRVSFLCEACGVEVFDKPYRKKRTCSKECRDVLLRRRGEEHHNYKGELAGFRQRQRIMVECREWRAEVMRLADYTCVACGVRGGDLTAHHLYNWSEHEDRRFDLDNGACVCWPCHWEFHREYGYKFTTREMFDQWITSLKEQPSATD